MVPDDAVVVWRFRDLAAYDALRTPPSDTGAPAAPASASLGAEINLPGLPGIDRHRPLLEITLDPSRRADPRFHVLPVENADLVRKTFADPNLPERHARHVAVHGAWAAAGWDASVVKRAGRGSGLFPADRGEDWCVSADWPRFVESNLLPQYVRGETVAGVLKALGVDPQSIRVTPAGAGALIDVPGADRVLLVWHRWQRVTLYGWGDQIRAELLPAEGSALSNALREAGPESPVALFPEDGAEATLALAGASGRRVLALALRDAGLAWPDAVAKDGFAALHLDVPGSLYLWSEAVPGDASSWPVGIAGKKGALPDLEAFGLPAVAPGLSAPLPPGAAPLIAPYGAAAPAGKVARRAAPSGDVHVVALGIGAETTAERAAASPALDAVAQEPAGNASEGRVVARFRLSRAAAQRLLGKALATSGLLAPLSGGDIEGTLATDGVRLILEARRVKT